MATNTWSEQYHLDYGRTPDITVALAVDNVDNTSRPLRCNNNGNLNVAIVDPSGTEYDSGNPIPVTFGSTGLATESTLSNIDGKINVDNSEDIANNTAIDVMLYARHTSSHVTDIGTLKINGGHNLLVTDSNVETLNNKVFNGQQTMANSVSVVMASNQTDINTLPIPYKQGYREVWIGANNASITTNGEGDMIPDYNSAAPFPFLSIAEAHTIVSTSAQDISGGTPGTGLRRVQIIGIDGNWDEVSEFIDMSGTNAVTTSNSYLRINEVIPLEVGTGLENAGKITVKTTTGTRTVYEIDDQQRHRLSGHYTVPDGYKGLLVTTACGVGGVGDQRYVLAVYKDGYARKNIFDIYAGSGSTYSTNNLDINYWLDARDTVVLRSGFNNDGWIQANLLIKLYPV